VRSQAASTAGTITAPACTAALEGVVKVLAMRAVPLTKAAPTRSACAHARSPCTAVIVPTRKRALDVILITRGDAQAHHVDQQILAFARRRRRQHARRECNDFPASVSATETFGSWDVMMARLSPHQTWKILV